jgi:hypothetical protein
MRTRLFHRLVWLAGLIVVSLVLTFAGAAVLAEGAAAMEKVSDSSVMPFWKLTTQFDGYGG